jgi:hypothetical protein
MKPQPPQLKWFKVKVLKAGKVTYKRLLSISGAKAIEQANKILKYVPGTGSAAKAVEAEEDT